MADIVLLRIGVGFFPSLQSTSITGVVSFEVFTLFLHLFSMAGEDSGSPPGKTKFCQTSSWSF